MFANVSRPTPHQSLWENVRSRAHGRSWASGPAVCPAGALAICLALAPLATASAGEANWDVLGRAYEQEARPLIRQYCHACHAAQRSEADLNFESLATFAEARGQTQVWERVAEMVGGAQMPPPAAPQPNAAERARLHGWVRALLTATARSQAGDPGPVVLRRLNNAEYTYTLRDLTGVESLDPAREFPVDGAAGEGFTNAGHALVMSPALITKYLDAAKEVAGHAVLLPDGFRFSPHTTRSDWTNETLTRIREFYREFTDQGGGARVNLQGIVFDTNQGGRLPLEKYLAATLAEREALTRGEKTAEAVAREKGLSPKYLGGLWKMLNSPPAGGDAEPPSRSLLLDGVRARWQTAQANDAPALAAQIARWQQALWRFTSVGHIGKLNGPKAWLEPVSPLTARQEFKLKLPANQPAGAEVVLYLTATDAGDGNEQDFAVWERPRLVAPGRPDVLLRDVRAVTGSLASRRAQLTASAAKCLAAAAEASAAQGPLDLPALAQRHDVASDALAAWLDYLGIGAAGPANLGTPITRKSESSAGYDFVRGWVGDEALSVLANSSDQHVRIPGNMKPHSVAVHPAPTRSVVVGWRSPAATTLRISGAVQHAHPECGNGVAWSLELRRGPTRQRLAAGTSQGATPVPFGPLDTLAVRPGDVVALVINPRDGNHSCDLTALELTLADGAREWNLARDLSPDILSGNPHVDGYGHAAVWHFFSEPASGAPGYVIPAGSLLARWQAAVSADEQRKLADELQRLLQGGVGSRAADAPDAVLYQQLTSLGGPLLSAAWRAIVERPGEPATVSNSPFGLDPAQFGKHPKATATVDAASLCVQAPAVIEVRLPADLVVGAEFVTTGTLHAETGREGSVQLQVLTAKPEQVAGLQPTAVAETNAAGPWTSNNRDVSHATPVIVAEGSAARRRFEAAFADFRRWFPTALCYTKIVPVDEVVTLTLFYREDDHLRRLILDDAQAARLDRLWDELHFISQDALKLVDAFEQLWQYATQDADPKVFEPMRQPIQDRATAFRQQVLDAQPKHLVALWEFAARVYRRPLQEPETRALTELYRSLRQQELPHDEAFRLVLARLFVAPAFLYRAERSPEAPPAAGPAAGDELVAAHPITGFELATRLSYFLWSSVPDAPLLEFAASGRLHQDEELRAQTRRMLQDPRVRRLAAEFAAQWVHLYQFDTHDEKSPAAFPTFAGLRGAMYEEFLRFFTDLVQRDGSLLELLDADHTFLNADLAQHYGITGVTGADWQRVAGLRQHGRGGLLGMAAPLAKQAGASRTSPILRGNWVSEVLLGEKTPKPPKGVPPLPEAVPTGLTERQLIERHTTDPACAKCHARIDPLGFALEGFDAIGRTRQAVPGAPLNTRATLIDGNEIDGLDGLRTYLVTTRRDAFVRQFCRKLLGYSLGRAVQLSDEPLLEELTAALQAHDYRVSVAVEAIVQSPQFRMVR